MSEVTVGIIGLVAVLALFLTGIELGFGMALISGIQLYCIHEGRIEPIGQGCL
jgi:hypothetical protein